MSEVPGTPEGLKALFGTAYTLRGSPSCSGQGAPQTPAGRGMSATVGTAADT
ncbi:hypothetical protein [Microtetraspora malaysiensis]|uniref:hypothetical protein n=1 Tax=Microtetraspora malaysiensis TaxID=161358 RepID=UPI003D8C8B17